MTLRIRTNVAWFMRGIAKALNARANAMDPVRLDPAKIAMLLPLTDEVLRDARPNAELVETIVLPDRDGKPVMTFNHGIPRGTRR